MSITQTRRSVIRVAGTAAAVQVSRPFANAQQTPALQLPFVVCFEVEPTPDGIDRYLAEAKNLLPKLRQIPGFLSIERSLDTLNERRLLSLSYWADEAALVAWRVQTAHHDAQLLGRNELFADYRLRVAQVVRQWTPERATSAERRTPTNETPYHQRHFLAIAQVEIGEDAGPDASQAQNAPGLNTHDPPLDWQAYRSLVNRGRLFLVTTLPDEESGKRLQESLATTAPKLSRFQICEVERDYGRFQREQAPQYFPPVSEGTRRKGA